MATGRACTQSVSGGRRTARATGARGGETRGGGDLEQLGVPCPRPRTTCLSLSSVCAAPPRRDTAPLPINKNKKLLQEIKQLREKIIGLTGPASPRPSRLLPVRHGPSASVSFSPLPTRLACRGRKQDDLNMTLSQDHTNKKYLTCSMFVPSTG